MKYAIDDIIVFTEKTPNNSYHGCLAKIIEFDVDNDLIRYEMLKKNMVHFSPSSLISTMKTRLSEKSSQFSQRALRNYNTRRRVQRLEQECWRKF